MSREIKPLSPEQQALHDRAAREANSAEARAKLAAAAAARQPYSTQYQTSVAGASQDRPNPATMITPIAIGPDGIPVKE